MISRIASSSVRIGQSRLRSPTLLRWRSVLLTLTAAGVALATSLLLVQVVTTSARWKPPLPSSVAGAASPDTTTRAESTAALQTEVARAAARLEGRIPDEPYVVINTMENRLYLMQDRRLLREAICSTGSFARLEGPSGQRWHFKTPRGHFQVLSKLKNPTWIKPDWAFVEEGKAIPARTATERAEHGVLGRYALSLGDGYLIHGTLYTRLLGLPVTHGCVRLGDEDLEAVYLAARVGTSVFVY